MSDPRCLPLLGAFVVGYHAAVIAQVLRDHLPAELALRGPEQRRRAQVLSAQEQINAAAEAWRAHAKAAVMSEAGLLALNGLRIGEALSRDVEHLTYDFGHRVLELTRKGGKRSTEALARPPPGRSRPTSASAPAGRSSSPAKAVGWPSLPPGGLSAGWLDKLDYRRPTG